MATVALLAACGGGGDGTPTGTTPTTPPPVTPPPVVTPGFTLTLGTPVPASIRQGDSLTVTVTLARTGGFSGAVTLSLDSVPAALVASWSTTRLEGSATSATLQLVASRATPPATYRFAVRATADGQTPRTAAGDAVVTLRPFEMTLRNLRTTPLIMARAGLPVTFDLIASRDGVPDEVRFDVADTLPRGLLVTFDPPTTLGGGTRVTLRADSAAVPGTYTSRFRVRAPATLPDSVAPPAIVDVAYTITEAARTRLSLSFPSVTVSQNASASITATLIRERTTQPLTLSHRGVPNGVVVDIEELVGPGIDTSNFVVRFVPDSSAAPGTYPVMLLLSSPGASSDSASLQLTITAAPVGGNTAFAFCGPPAHQPIWFGRGRGFGNWTRVLPDGDGRYVFDVTSSNTDVLWVTQQGPDDFAITSVSGTGDELRALADRSCLDATGRTLTGTVAGLGPTDVGAVTVGPRIASPAPTALAPAFTIADLGDAPVDVLAARLQQASTPGGWFADRVLVRRSVLPSVGTLGTLDLAAGVATEALTLTASNVAAGELVTWTSRFVTSSGASLGLGTTTGTATSGEVRVVPAAARAAGDLHAFAVTATSADGQSSRTVESWRATPTATTLTLLPSVSLPTLNVRESDGVFARFNVSFETQPGYDRTVLITLAQEAGATRRRITHLRAGSILGLDRAPRSLSVRPNFDGASGWNQSWEPRRELPVQWSLLAIGWDDPNGAVAPQQDGVLVRRAQRTGTFFEP